MPAPGMNDIVRPAPPRAVPHPPFEFPPATAADDRGRVHVGGELEPSTMLAGYRAGLFPMGRGEAGVIWWSPEPRAVIVPAAAHLSHSLLRARKAFEIRVDTAFAEVVAACAERAPGEFVWITDEVRAAYERLHELGWAHSVEAWLAEGEGEAELAGGLYGIAIGGAFFGESMFHRRRDASKVAFAALLDLLTDAGRDADERLIDCQWLTPHLASLGAVEVPRETYLERLAVALRRPLPPAFGGPAGPA
jgi:leucyl/phenylalanyl-tRNA--protein transferase